MSFPKNDCAAKVGTGAAQGRTQRQTDNPNLSPLSIRPQVRSSGLIHIGEILRALSTQHRGGA